MPLVLPGSGKLRSLSLNKILPNLVTLLALSAGLTSLRYGLRGEFEHAVFALFLAAIFDGLDGRVARKLRSSSKFGAELDSLSDVVSFGVAPAVLLYMWTMLHAGGIGWAVCVIFTLCMALRLARFNTMLGDPDLPAYMHSYFTGVPAPAAALLGIFPMVLSFQFGDLPFASPWLVGPYMLGISFLMVCKLPTFSMKRFRIPAPWVLPFMIGIGLSAALLVTDPWMTLSVIGLVYLGSIPCAYFSVLRLEKYAHRDMKSGKGTAVVSEDAPKISEPLSGVPVSGSQHHEGEDSSETRLH